MADLNYKLSPETIKAIGDDLINQYLTNENWLEEAVSSLSEVMVGEDGNSTPLFNSHDETVDVRDHLECYLTERLCEMIRSGNNQGKFTF
jgi:hypothetical protein